MCDFDRCTHKSVQWPRNTTGAKTYHDSKSDTKDQKSCIHRLHAQHQKASKPSTKTSSITLYCPAPQENGNRNHVVCWWNLKQSCAACSCHISAGMGSCMPHDSCAVPECKEGHGFAYQGLKPQSSASRQQLWLHFAKSSPCIFVSLSFYFSFSFILCDSKCCSCQLLSSSY